MPPQPATELSQSSSPGNLDFANPAFFFVNRVRRLPGLSLFLSCSIAAIVIVTLAGAFGTASIAPARRLLFWTLLIGFNTCAWICWFALLVGTDRDWWRVTLLGLPVLNLPVPFEIGLALRMIGGPEANAWGWLWARAAIISAALLLVIAIGLRRDPPLAQAAAAPKGRLWRAGIAEPAAIVRRTTTAGSIGRTAPASCCTAVLQI